jgi:hypothetical protein
MFPGRRSQRSSRGRPRRDAQHPSVRWQGQTEARDVFVPALSQPDSATRPRGCRRSGRSGGWRSGSRSAHYMQPTLSKADGGSVPRSRLGRGRRPAGSLNRATVRARQGDTPCFARSLEVWQRFPSFRSFRGVHSGRGRTPALHRLCRSASPRASQGRETRHHRRTPLPR